MITLSIYPSFVYAPHSVPLPFQTDLVHIYTFMRDVIFVSDHSNRILVCGQPVTRSGRNSRFVHGGPVTKYFGLNRKGNIWMKGNGCRKLRLQLYIPKISPLSFIHHTQARGENSRAQKKKEKKRSSRKKIVWSSHRSETDVKNT